MKILWISSTSSNAWSTTSSHSLGLRAKVKPQKTQNSVCHSPRGQRSRSLLHKLILGVELCRVWFDNHYAQGQGGWSPPAPSACSLFFPPKCPSNPPKGNEKRTKKQKTEQERENKNKITNLNFDKSIIKLSVNGLNTSAKGQWLAEWTKKHHPTKCCYNTFTSNVT